MRQCHCPSILLLLLLSGQSFSQQIRLQHYPQKPFLEQVDGGQSCNFDIIVKYEGTDTLSLTRFSLQLFDNNDMLLQEKFLDANGTAPSIQVISAPGWHGKSQHTIFNPFPTSVAEVPVHYYVYSLVFRHSNQTEEIVSDTVFPSRYEQYHSFALPLRNRLLVYDAHDLYSHHRRFDYEMPFIRQFGFRGNFMRYAYDFMVVDNRNQKFKSDGGNFDDWWSFGEPVLAVAAGRIIAVETRRPDDRSFETDSLKANPLALYGNYVVIEHAKGIISIYGHLRQFSVNVKVGDKVSRGMQIGAIGTSGSSFFPHLHFEVRNNIGHDAEGIPSYFSHYYKWLGSKKMTIRYGTVNTGDIIEAK